MPIRREVFVASLRNCFSHHCCEEALPPRAEDMNNAGAQRSFLSVSLVNQRQTAFECGSKWRRRETAVASYMSNRNQAGELHGTGLYQLNRAQMETRSKDQAKQCPV